jgi:DNA polymerase-3 subunit epsilon
MKPIIKYWLFILGIALSIVTIIGISFVASWFNLEIADRELVEPLINKLVLFPMLGALVVFLIVGGMTSLLFRFYIIPILQLAEETRLITAVNPKYRANIQGGPEVQQLINIINESAAANEKLQYEVEERITQSAIDLDKERTRLAALMSELPHGVIVCNTDGQILLYNQQVRTLIEEKTASASLIGLGRSIFALLERNQIVHAIDILQHAINNKQSNLTTGFMQPFDQLYLRVKMAPILDQQDDNRVMSGFVLTIEDMAPQIEADNSREIWLQSLTDEMKASLGKIQQTITHIIDTPGITTDSLNEKRHLIKESTESILARLEKSQEESARHIRSAARHEEVMGADILNIFKQHIRRRYDITVYTDIKANSWLSVDSYIIVQGLAFLVGRLQKRGNINSLAASTDRVGKESVITLTWQKEAISRDGIIDWAKTPLVTDRFSHTFNFKNFIKSHNGRIEFLPTDEETCSGISIYLPLKEESSLATTGHTFEQRPIFYEFNLFKGEMFESLVDIPLNRLTFVAFDTETTGLNPSEGDEIIQIGAIRGVNGKILYNETVDQLVDPQRSLPKIATEITGITPEMLTNQPLIDPTLQQFHKFVDKAVLVAHNAAFDMRFLELREKSSGVKFRNPVLDTLLLSSIVHPNQQSHSLDAIAERMNLTIVGRHTGLGDAIVTAEIMVRLIPLLEAQGIKTLGEAIEASHKSAYAKFKY